MDYDRGNWKARLNLYGDSIVQLQHLHPYVSSENRFDQAVFDHALQILGCDADPAVIFTQEPAVVSNAAGHEVQIEIPAD